MKKINWSMLLGGFLIGLIVLCMLFPKLFTTVNPYGTQYIQYNSQVGGAGTVSSPPYPPSKQYLLGSDMLGRDIFSMIVYGTKLTISLGFFILIGRFLLAIPLGLGAGFGSRLCKAILNQFSIIFSSVPIVIISYIVLSMPFFSNLYRQESVIAFAGVLTIVGFGKLGKLIEERVTGILDRDFIKGEIAIGKSKIRIAIENVVPHLSQELIVLFFMEFAAALTLIMQLGIFNVFVGNLKILEDKSVAGTSVLPLSFEPEWASMLGASRTNIVSSPWTVIPPAVAFTISILGFNLFAEGLREKLYKRDSGFIPFIRKCLTIEKQDLKLTNLNPVKGKFRWISIISLGVLLYLFTLNISNMKYSFDSSRLSYKDNFSEVITGSREAETTANRIAKELKTYGYEPISKEGYILPYNLDNEFYCYAGSAKLEDKGESGALRLGTDFSPGSFGNYEIQGKIYDTTPLDLFDIQNYSVFDNKLVLINGNLYSNEAMYHFSDEIMKNSNAKGVLLLVKNGGELPKIFGKLVLKYPMLWITKETASKIISSKDNSLDVAIKCKKLKGIGRNILGMLPGADEKMKQEPIMIGLGYNYMKAEGNNGRARIRFDLEMLRKLASMKRDRPILLAFWDGTFTEDCNGKVYYSNHSIYDPSKIASYVDLTKLSGDKAAFVYFNSDLSPVSRYFSWAFAHNLKNELKKNTEVLNYRKIRAVSDVMGNTPNEDEAMYYNGNLPVIILAEDGSSRNGQNGKSISMDKIGSIVLEVIQKNKY